VSWLLPDELRPRSIRPLTQRSLSPSMSSISILTVQCYFTGCTRSTSFSFQSHATIDSLAAQPLDSPVFRQFLTDRGRKFVQLRGQHYLEYHDFLLTRGMLNQLIKFRAVGRAMVDGSSYHRMNGHGDHGRLTEIKSFRYRKESSLSAPQQSQDIRL